MLTSSTGSSGVSGNPFKNIPPNAGYGRGDDCESCGWGDGAEYGNGHGCGDGSGYGTGSGYVCGDGRGSGWGEKKERMKIKLQIELQALKNIPDKDLPLHIYDWQFEETKREFTRRLE